MSKKKGSLDAPIVFRVSEKDFDSTAEWQQYLKYQEWLSENNKRSEFNRQASIEKTLRFIHGEEEKWKQLERIVKDRGMDVVLQTLLLPTPQSPEIDVEDLAKKVALLLDKDIKPILPEEKGKEIPKNDAKKLMNLF